MRRATAGERRLDTFLEGLSFPAVAKLADSQFYVSAAENGVTKIALGHHRDDIVETMFLNMFFGSKLKAMPPKLLSDDGKNIVIRPLAYCKEADIAEFSRLMEFPIGLLGVALSAVLTPQLLGVEEASNLPNASTFCGRCESVCPVRIPLPGLMRHWREREFERHLTPPTARWGLGLWAWLARRPQLYRLATGLAARLLVA